MVVRVIHQEVAMRASRGAVAVGVGLVLQVLVACAAPPQEEQPPVVTAFRQETSGSAQAGHAQAPKARTDLEECRQARQQGVYPRERNFPCEAFLGE
jgi:hypothetical protein